MNAFISGVPNKARREDAFALTRMMSEVTGEKPVMWGTSIVGFGSYSYRYARGGEGIAPRVGFSPRSNRMVLYLAIWRDEVRDRLAALGPHETSVSCLYLKSLADVDRGVLKEMIAASFRHQPVPGQEFPNRDKRTAASAGKKKAGNNQSAATANRSRKKAAKRRPRRVSAKRRKRL